jgi:UDP:flavonoid glycosyltransferase YjiC (YdhE family)
LFEGQFSPTLTLGLFSRLLATPQPDWPRNVTVTASCSTTALRTLQRELETFLDAGPPPIVFTLGTSRLRRPAASTKSVDAVRRLGREAVLSHGGYEQNRPRGTFPREYSCVDSTRRTSCCFRRAAAVVHQGGAGTLAQALRAPGPCS